MPPTPSSAPDAAPVAAAPPSRLGRPRDYALLAALTLAFLLPFINKAFHIDDPLFIWSARRIHLHPGDPYGFLVNWYNKGDQPMDLVTQNPPLACYYLALAAAIWGWSEPALHAAMLLPAVGVILGSYRLARRFCSTPVLAGLATLACPVFVISSSTVMCDTLMVCFWVWAIVLWVEGLDSGPGWFAVAAPIAAGILAAAAVMTKYFGVSLIPLLLVYALVRRRYLQPLALLIPVAALIAYQSWTHHLYGEGLLKEPVAYVKFFSHVSGRPLGKTLLTLLSFTGGCLLPGLALFPMLVSRPMRLLVTGLFILVLLGLVYGFFGDVLALKISGKFNGPLAVELALFVAGGVAILILTAQDLAQRRDADALLLGLWIAGTFTFAGFVNWSINGRSILPMAPAVGILFARRWEARKIKGGGGPWGGGEVGSGGFRSALPTLRGWDWRWVAPLVISAIVALAVAGADQSLANANRDAARRIVLKYGRLPGAGPGGGGQLWFEGHWGFQYYMQNEHARPLNYYNINFNPGDVIAEPLNNTNIRKVTGPLHVVERMYEPVTPWISTTNSYAGAGFYTDLWGSAPFVVGHNITEQYTILKVTRPMRGVLPESKD